MWEEEGRQNIKSGWEISQFSGWRPSYVYNDKRTVWSWRCGNCTKNYIWRCECEKKFVQSLILECSVTNERRAGNSREIIEIINPIPRKRKSLVACDESWIYCYNPEYQKAEIPKKTSWLFHVQEGQVKQIHWEAHDDPHFRRHHLHSLGFLWPDGQQKRTSGEFLREFR